MERYKVYIDTSGIGNESVLLYEGEDKKLAQSFIPDIYAGGGLNGRPCYKFVRIISDGDEEMMEVIRYVWQESFMKESWFKRLMEKLK